MDSATTTKPPGTPHCFNSPVFTKRLIAHDVSANLFLSVAVERRISVCRVPNIAVNFSRRKFLVCEQREVRSIDRERFECCSSLIPQPWPSLRYLVTAKVEVNEVARLLFMNCCHPKLRLSLEFRWRFSLKAPAEMIKRAWRYIWILAPLVQRRLLQLNFAPLPPFSINLIIIRPGLITISSPASMNK